MWIKYIMFKFLYNRPWLVKELEAMIFCIKLTNNYNPEENNKKSIGFKLLDTPKV
jgi:hypothetical protein